MLMSALVRPGGNDVRRQFLRKYNGTVSSLYVAVFDIDETSLSNREEWLQLAPFVSCRL